MDIEEALQFAELPICNEAVARSLHYELGFSVAAAIAWARSGGRCEYCRRDLIVDRFGYAGGEVDHLLSIQKHPTVGNHPLNWYLACRLCNGTKGPHSVMNEGWDPAQALESEAERERMIQAAREYIERRLREKHDPAWEAAKRIIDP